MLVSMCDCVSTPTNMGLLLFCRNAFALLDFCIAKLYSVRCDNQSNAIVTILSAQQCYLFQLVLLLSS